MERREEVRYPRRFPVRFWRRGETQAHTGFTTNVSVSGLFLGTGHSLTIGERLRMELVDEEHGFIAEGRVARVHRVALALRHVEQPGVGVRFLAPEELVSELIPAARAAAGSRRGTRPRGAPAPSFESPGSDEPAAHGEAPAERDPSAATTPEEEVGLEVIPVEFVDPTSFLSVYHRDIQSGGLFLSTASPADLEQVVVIELTVPTSEDRPLRFRARVVHRTEPTAAVGRGKNLLAGMGVQFLEPDRVLEQLGPVLAALRR